MGLILSILIGLALCFVVGAYAESKGRNGAFWIIVSLLVTPIPPLVLIAAGRDYRTGEQRMLDDRRKRARSCRFCKRAVRTGATKCGHCGSELKRQGFATG